MKLRITTGSVSATQAAAEAFGGVVRGGDVVLLAGELGAGKTAFTQGLGRSLGVEDPITSPTFTLARHYDGRDIALHHLDVYRVDRTHELFDVGLPEILDGNGVVVVEWGDAVAPAVGTEYLTIELHYGDADDDRLIDIEPVGPSWHERWDRITDALRPWTGGAAPC